MRRIVAVIAACAVLAGAAVPVRAQDAPVELTPSSPWVLDYAEDSCALRRRFGEVGQHVDLELRKFGRGVGFQVIVVSADFAALTNSFAAQFVPLNQQPFPIEGRYNLDFGNGMRGRLFNYSISEYNQEYNEIYMDFIEITPALFDEQRALVTEAIDLSTRLFAPQSAPSERDRREYDRLLARDNYQTAARRAFYAFQQTDTYRELLNQQEATVTGFGLYDAFAEPLMLRTGSLDSPMDAMDACLDELMSHWGIDVEAHRHLTRAVEPYDYESLVEEIGENYPRDMLRERRLGALRIRLDVAPDGTTTGCHLQSGISDDSFEETACNIMMRHARFYPALDALGQPIASYYQVAVQYQLN